MLKTGSRGEGARQVLLCLQSQEHPWQTVHELRAGSPFLHELSASNVSTLCRRMWMDDKTLERRLRKGSFGGVREYEYSLCQEGASEKAPASTERPKVGKPPTYTEVEVQELLKDIDKWRRRAETLQMMVDNTIESHKSTQAILDATQQKLLSARMKILTDVRLNQIAEVVGKPLGCCPVCGKVFISPTGKTGCILCDECYGRRESAWPNELTWSLAGNGTLTMGGTWSVCWSHENGGQVLAEYAQAE